MFGFYGNTYFVINYRKFKSFKLIAKNQTQLKTLIATQFARKCKTMNIFLLLIIILENLVRLPLSFHYIFGFRSKTFLKLCLQSFNLYRPPPPTLVCLFAQASMFVQARRHYLTAKSVNFQISNPKCFKVQAPLKTFQSKFTQSF